MPCMGAVWRSVMPWFCCVSVIFCCVSVMCVCVFVCMGVVVCWCVCVCVVCCVFVCVVARWKNVEKPVCGFKNAFVYTFRTSPCMLAPRVHVFSTCGHVAGTHENVLNAHTLRHFERTHGDVFECTHGGEGRGRGWSGHRQFCLPKFAQGGSSSASEVHLKKPLDLTHSRFENKSRTTRSRFLQSFALPDKAVQLQPSRECATSTHTIHTHTHPHTQPQHTATQHATPHQHIQEREGKMRETRQDKTRQDKTRQDKTRQDKTRQDKTRPDKTRQDQTRLQTVGCHYESHGFSCRLPALVLNFLTTLTFRALHANHIVSTPFQTIVEETLTFHQTHYPPLLPGNPWTIQ